VFCERLVVRTGEDSAFGRSLYRIGEVTGSRAIAKRKGAAVTDTLCNVQSPAAAIRRAALRTAKKTATSHQIPGSHAQGGGGFRKPDLLTVLSFYRNGPTQLYEAEAEEEYIEFRKKLRDIPATANGVPADSALVKAMSQLEINLRVMCGCPSDKPMYRARKKVLTDIRRNRSYIGSILRDKSVNATLIELERQPKYIRETPNLRKRLLRLIYKRKYAAALTLLQKTWHKTIDTEAVLRTLHMTIPSSGHENVFLWTLQAAPLVRSSNSKRLVS
jgi:hypothetical protein